MYWLLRAAPAHMLRLQNGRFDAPDRLFHGLAESWESVNNSTTDVKVRACGVVAGPPWVRLQTVSPPCSPPLNLCGLRHQQHRQAWFPAAFLQRAQRVHVEPSRALRSACGSPACVLALLACFCAQELIPEFFLPGGNWLVNALRLPLGLRQSGQPVEDVELPPWSGHGEHAAGARRTTLGLATW